MTRIGKFSAPGGVGVVSFAAGYVAYGTIDDQETLATWFSTDGRDWRRTVHSKTVVPCKGWSARSDLEGVYNATVVHGELVIVASLVAPTVDDCNRHRLVALVTTNGTDWERSTPFGPAGSEFEWSQEAWAIPDGVEVKVSQSEERWSIWRSPDGFAWDEVSSGPAPADGPSFGVLGADQHGLRLAAESSDDVDTILFASDDGSTWRRVKTLPYGHAVIATLPPHQDGESWLLAIANWETGGVQLLRSADLVTWRSARFPRSAIGSLLSTPDGLLAVGSTWVPALAGGPAGPPPDPALYWSPDGVIWSKQAAKLRSTELTFVDGPAGILAIVWMPPGSITVSRVRLP